MPRGNPQNLIPAAHALTVEEASKGGTNSGKRRREKRAIKELLEDYLDSPPKKTPALKTLCQKIGVKESASVKEVFVVKCVLNALQNGELDDLARLQEILGESISSEEPESDGFLEALEEKAGEVWKKE